MSEKMNAYLRFVALKNEIKVNKNIKNLFGGFMFRNKEQIQEELKPLELKYNLIVNTTDELEVIEGRIFDKSTAYVIDCETGEIVPHLSSVAYSEYQKLSATKMNESQLSGSASSYAGKFALQNLLGLDDNRDADNDTDQHAKTGKDRATVADEKQPLVVNETKPIPAVKVSPTTTTAPVRPAVTPTARPAATPTPTPAAKPVDDGDTVVTSIEISDEKKRKLEELRSRYRSIASNVK